ncbi:type II CAAX endopeptidase family protein [Thermosyntropha sp.]|uniref:CPBP family intramembrane glutamic endopeptidase n=1 Tax=Thermosyntropha sp. TaxID=2740820 RepID=UPI0025CEF047|nr:type II CAAX endopeptidase family protein [Thermosyntropha sp.]MBO8158123.1 CPBP family intramembrane metalloprotease [Thermosyntropha sp.]
MKNDAVKGVVGLTSYKKEITWGWLDIILVYVGIVATGLIFNYFVPDIMKFMYSKGMEANEINLFMLSFFLQFIVTVSLILFFALGVRKASLSDLGIKNVSFFSYLVYGLGGGLFLIAVILLLSVFVNYLKPDLNPQAYEEIIRTVKSFPQFLLVFLAGTVMAPLSEELFFRGMIYPVFRKYTGSALGMVLAGTVFGLAHWDLWRAVPLSIGGIVLCYIYEKSGSILVSALAHGIWNGVMALALYMSLFNGI